MNFEVSEGENADNTDLFWDSGEYPDYRELDFEHGLHG